MRGRLANTVRLRVAAETQPLIRLRAGPQTPSPKGEGISSQKLPPSLQNGYSPRPLHILWSHSLCGGILYVGAAFTVFSGRRGLYCARAGLAGHYPLDDVRSGRGLPLPFAKAGRCTAAAGRGRRPRRSRRQRASAGWSWRWGQSAAACCTPRCGTIPPSGGMWPGLSARGTPFTGFCSAGGSSLCCGA